MSDDIYDSNENPFILQDITHAFTCMAIFFPDIEICAPATEFFKSTEGSKYRDTQILKPLERSKTVPKHRTRASNNSRPDAFFHEWRAISKECKRENVPFRDRYPKDWSIAVRPIIAKCEFTRPPS